jgi:hypothetical protein
MNVTVAAIIAIVSSGIIFVAIIYTVYSDLIAARVQNITTTPPTDYTTTTHAQRRE